MKNVKEINELNREEYLIMIIKKGKKVNIISLILEMDLNEFNDFISSLKNVYLRIILKLINIEIIVNKKKKY